MAPASPCTQCGKPSIVSNGDVHLCVDCFAKYQNAVQQQQRGDLQRLAFLMAAINYTDDHIYGLVGLQPPRRLEIPEAAARLLASELSVKNVFNIENSVIGNLNAGIQRNLGNIAVNVGALDASGNQALAEAVREIAGAVAKEPGLGDDQRQGLLEQVEELSTQASRPAQQRSKPAAIAAIVAGLGQGLQAAGGLATVWTTWGPAIRAFFGL